MAYTIGCSIRRARGIGAEPDWENVQIMGHETLNLKQLEHLKNDRELDSSSLMFEVHPTLGIETINDLITAARKVFSEAIA